MLAAIDQVLRAEVEDARHIESVQVGEVPGEAHDVPETTLQVPLLDLRQEPVPVQSAIGSNSQGRASVVRGSSASAARPFERGAQ